MGADRCNRMLPFAIAAPAWLEDARTGTVVEVNEHALALCGCSRDVFVAQGWTSVTGTLAVSNGQLLEQVRIPLCAPHAECGSEIVLVVMRKHVAESDAAGPYLNAVTTEAALRFAGVGIVQYHVDAGEAILDSAAASIFGLQPNHRYPVAAVGRRVHSGDLGPIWQSISGALKKEEGLSDLEFRARNADGENKWVRGFARVTERDAEGNPRVLTQVVRAEDCRHDPELLNRSFAVWPDAFLVIKDIITSQANPAAVRLFGADSEQALVGRNAFELFSPTHRKLVGSVAARLLQSDGGSETGRLRIMRLDKSEVEVEFLAFGFPGRIGQIQVMLRSLPQAEVWNSVII